MTYRESYESPLGRMIMVSDGTALTALAFQGQKYYEKAVPWEAEEARLPIFDHTGQWLDIYFSGQEPTFTPTIATKGTLFQEEVWEILKKIPYGQVVSYGEIAAAIAKSRGLKRMSAQAVGGAVGHNPVSVIIPCHRVVGTNGHLTGYAGGLDKKEELLRLERADHTSVIRLMK